jgi:ribose-phosphate pyrophosphokinase
MALPDDAGTHARMVVALPDALELARSIAWSTGAGLAPAELRSFEDGEFKARPTLDPAGRHCLVVGVMHGDARESPQDRMGRLLFLIAALKDHRAARVDLLVPYLPYARKDRRTQPFDPVSLRYLAQLLEAVGTDSVGTIEVHQPAAFDNAFRIPAQSLPGHHLLAGPVIDYLRSLDGEPLVVASPDPGGIKRAQLWQETLEAMLTVTGLESPIGFASVDKRRSLDQLSGASHVCADVKDATVLMIDDLLVSGSTLARASEAFRAAGASRVIAAVMHDLHTSEALRRLEVAGIEHLITGDTLPERPAGGARLARMVVDRVPCAHALAGWALRGQRPAHSNPEGMPRSSA